MSLDTLPIVVPPHVVKKYLDSLDIRGEAYSFEVTSDNRRFPITLELNRGGCEDALSITLYESGNWSAEHVIVVGEKE